MLSKQLHISTDEQVVYVCVHDMQLVFTSLYTDFHPAQRRFIACI